MITTYPRAEGENWTERREGSSKTSGFDFPQTRPRDSIGADRVDVTRVRTGLRNTTSRNTKEVRKHQDSIFPRHVHVIL